MGWIQLASEVESRQCLVKLIHQNQQPISKTVDLQVKEKGKPKAPGESQWDQRFYLGKCLRCGGEGHFAARYPSVQAPASRTPTQANTPCVWLNAPPLDRRCIPSQLSLCWRISWRYLTPPHLIWRTLVQPRNHSHWEMSKACFRRCSQAGR